MLATFKSIVDYLSSPTISFTILTVLTPLVFPPTDWFDKISRKLGIHLLWTKAGCAIGMVLITIFLHDITMFSYYFITCLQNLIVFLHYFNICC